MKNIFGKFFIVIILIFSIFSCKEQVVRTKQQSFEQTVYLVPTDTARGLLNVKIELEYPETYASPAVLDSIYNTLVINMFGKEFLGVPFDSIPKVYAQSIIADYKSTLSDLQEYEKKVANFSMGAFYRYVEGFPLLNDGRIFSYGYTRDSYTGGTQGYKSFNYFNFDLKTGHWLEESDIFTDNYQNPLANLLRKKILEQNPQALSLDSVQPNSNFYVSDEGITYLFNVSEIPLNAVETEVFLPYGDLNTILRKDSPISYLAAAAK